MPFLARIAGNHRDVRNNMRNSWTKQMHFHHPAPPPLPFRDFRASAVVFFIPMKPLRVPPPHFLPPTRFSAMAAQFGHAFTAELTTHDVTAFSKAVSVLQGIRKRRQAAKLAAAASVRGAVPAGGPAAAAAASGDDGVVPPGVPEDGGEWGGGGGRDGGRRTATMWSLEKEVELLSKARDAGGEGRVVETAVVGGLSLYFCIGCLSFRNLLALFVPCLLPEV